MKNLLIWSVVFINVTLYAQSPSLTRSDMKLAKCLNLERKICKNTKTKYCEAVYINKDRGDIRCEAVSSNNIKTVCGEQNPILYDTTTACIKPKESSNCPASLKDIKIQDLELLYSCPKLHASICEKLCGARYDKVDVRNLTQLNRGLGIVCIDSSNEKMKNKFLLSDDFRARTECSEVHAGNNKWCVNYNRTFNEVSFGAFVQCLGRI